MSTRLQDYELERVCAEYLDRHFWPTLGAGFRRYADRAHQLNGVDLSLTTKDGNVLWFDEKFKVKGCLNEVYRWPGFEMSLLLDGRERDGWFGGTWA